MPVLAAPLSRHCHGLLLLEYSSSRHKSAFQSFIRVPTTYELNVTKSFNIYAHVLLSRLKWFVSALLVPSVLVSFSYSTSPFHLSHRFVVWYINDIESDMQ